MILFLIVKPGCPLCESLEQPGSEYAKKNGWEFIKTDLFDFKDNMPSESVEHIKNSHVVDNVFPYPTWVLSTNYGEIVGSQSCDKMEFLEFHKLKV